jgi:hypothetical protein
MARSAQDFGGKIPLDVASLTPQKQILRLAALAQDFACRLPLSPAASLTPAKQLKIKPAPILPRDFRRRL